MCLKKTSLTPHLTLPATTPALVNFAFSMHFTLNRKPLPLLQRDAWLYRTSDSSPLG